MSTYTAELQPDRGYYRSKGVGDKWMVSMQHSMPIIDLSEAEAKIIAFALNTIANGDKLAYMSESKNIGEPGAYGYYEGPVQGVAP